MLLRLAPFLQRSLPDLRQQTGLILELLADVVADLDGLANSNRDDRERPVITATISKTKPTAMARHPAGLTVDLPTGGMARAERGR
jgi:hypothetical protein